MFKGKLKYSIDTHTDSAVDRLSSKLSFARVSSVIILVTGLTLEVPDGMALNHKKGEAAGMTFSLLWEQLANKLATEASESNSKRSNSCNVS